MKTAQVRLSAIAAAVAFTLAFAAPAIAEQESPMITVLPGCPVVIASVDVVPAATDTFGDRHFAIQAMVGGTSKSTDAYIGAVSYVISDSTGPKPFLGSTDVVPSLLNINGFLKFTNRGFRGELSTPYRRQADCFNSFVLHKIAGLVVYVAAEEARDKVGRDPKVRR